MKNYRYLIIGGGIAGGMACVGIRKIDRQGSVALVSQEPYRPYERPPLSKKFLRQEVDLESVFLEKEDFYKKEKIEIFSGVKVIGLNREKQLAILENGEELCYERLLLATGGRSKTLPIPGINLKNVFTLRTIEDSKQIRSESGKDKKALIMGGSFIGVEVAASLSQIGTSVAMIFPESRLFEKIAPEVVSNHFHNKLRSNGIRIVGNTKAKELVGDEKVEKVVLDNGDEIYVDLVVMGVGIELNTELATNAGLQMLEEENAVVVDEYLQTSDRQIFAAGDIAAWKDETFERRLQVEHWDVARRQGIIAGRNMAGERIKYSALPYFFSDFLDFSFDAWGDFSKWEKSIIRGSVKNDSFAVFYFNDEHLTAVLSVKRPENERIPMQNLVKERPLYQKIADKLQDEATDLVNLEGKEMETYQHGSHQPLSFKNDIRPMFRDKDITEMIDISGFDLSDFDDVRERAENIFSRLSDGTMPCDEEWSEEQLTQFKSWMESGMYP